MKIIYDGQEFDLGNMEALKLAVGPRASRIVQQIQPEHRDEAFALILAQMLQWWILSGATIRMADATGSTGISLAQAIEQHNFVGAMLGEPEIMHVPDVEIEPPPLLDAEGQPIPPAPQPPLLDEGD